jgi:hypothetical protein
MNRTVALLWLVVTLLPFAYMFYFFGEMSAPFPKDHSAAEAQFNFMFRLHMAVIFGCWVLIASYIVYLFKSTHVPVEKRALWAVVLFLGNMIAMPIFWYLYVWRPLQIRPAGP